MDLHALTAAHLTDRPQNRFDLKDETAYYASAGAVRCATRRRPVTFWRALWHNRLWRLWAFGRTPQGHAARQETRIG